MIMKRITTYGFTLMEMVIVIAITGIVASVVAVFLRKPVQDYFDSGMRGEMTDTADTALRRIARDLRSALPNSVRVTGTCNTGTSDCTLEFIPTTGGGRYRVEQDAVGGGTPLDFSTTAASFDVIGPMPTLAANDQIVVYNLGITGADAYAGDNRATVSNVTSTTVSLSPAFQFKFDSPAHRFHVVSSPVRYVCAANATTPSSGTLTRISGYGWGTYTSGSGTSSILAKNVSSCLFTYDNAAGVVALRAGLVTMRLSISETSISGTSETVSLYHAVHVSNQP